MLLGARPGLLGVERQPVVVEHHGGGGACAAGSSPTATSARASSPRSSSAGDPDAFALSLPGRRATYPVRRVPGGLDVDLPTGTGDDAYLAALDDALEAASARRERPPRPSSAGQGADRSGHGDASLGRLARTKRRRLRARDELVLSSLDAASVPVCVVVRPDGYATRSPRHEDERLPGLAQRIGSTPLLRPRPTARIGRAPRG